jgi:thiol:disulfide interchange protein DsbC
MMNTDFKRLLAAAAAALACTAASAAAPRTPEAALLEQLRQSNPGTRFTSVSKTPIPGLFEVWMGPNVAFVSPASPRHFILGRLVDTVTMTDLTGPKLAAAAQAAPAADPASAGPPVQLDTLPVADAIKTVRGNGSRRLVVFSDPGCGFCKRLEPELAALTDVTIFTFLVPFQGRDLPEAVWCAGARERAWSDLMLRGDRSALGTARSCETPLDRNLALARQLRVNGTPTLFYADGSRTDGYAAGQEVEQRLAAASRPAARGESTSAARTAGGKL